MPRLVCMSDTHDKLEEYQFPIPDGDIFIHAGDFTIQGLLTEVTRFNRFLRTLPHKHKVVIAGNHELGFDGRDSYLLESMLSAHYLRDSGIELEGLRIWGSPWQPEFNNWAFNLPRGKALAEKWDLIPDNTDVLITHGPPDGIRDFLPHGEHVGCEELAYTVLDRVKPKVHIFGHIHHAYGISEVAGIKFINASICDEAYRPRRQPIVIDV